MKLLQAILEILEEGDRVTLFLKNGEIITGLFQFIDGDEFDGDVVLKPLDCSDNLMMLGWKIAFISKIKIGDENNN